MRKTMEQRFWEKVEKTDGCWNWTASKLHDGYGHFGVSNRVIKTAHRVAYELLVGPVPSGLELDHLCRNRSCVNPAHLEPVTKRTNQLRGASFTARNAAKTHCANGHAFTPENTYLRAKGHRGCRACNLAAVLRYKSRKAA